MKVALINPNLVAQTNDLLTTGIVYMPVSLAYFAASLRKHCVDCYVIDAFGEDPERCTVDGGYLTRGITPDEVVKRLKDDTDAVVVYASNLTYFGSLREIVIAVRRHKADIPIIVMENTQAVTAYSVQKVQEELFSFGVDYTIIGEAEDRGVQLLAALDKRLAPNVIDEIGGIGFRVDGHTYFRPSANRITELDDLPFPAWDLFPIQNYWRLKYAHGPMETDSYLPLLTSRGCPYPCRFCVIPETNGLKWRGRKPSNVVDEIEFSLKQYGVREFHIEDVDPTVSEKRIREICHELINRKLDIIWKICAGTKAETLRDPATVALMARAGCRYISISPESGSQRLLKLINKPCDADHVVRLVEQFHKNKINSQACFIIGFPGETDDDRNQTVHLVHRLVRAGIDEIALFIVTPVPGSAIFDGWNGYDQYSQLTFSPSWRLDYLALSRFRFRLYLKFVMWKAKYHPSKLARQPVNFLRRRFETKMEMAPYRALHTLLAKSFHRTSVDNAN